MTQKEKEIIEKYGLTEADFEPEKSYSHRVEALIRERYTVSDELAILRQRDSKPAEYSEYFAFCEDCKRRAKAEINNQ